MYKQRNWQWIFLQNVTFFCKCNSVRIALPDPDLEISGGGGRGGEGAPRALPLDPPLDWSEYQKRGIAGKISESLLTLLLTNEFINLN